MDRKYIGYEVRDRIARVTLTNPPVNALSTAVMTELDDAMQAAGRDPEVGVVLLTGAGEKAFAAGADIKEFLELTPLGAKRYADRGQEVLLRMERLGKPVIAAVNGFAFGGGCEVAMACHIRIASTRAVFGQPEVKLGLLPGFAGTQRFLRLCGKGRAHEWVLSGENIPAEEALRIGLVNRVVPPEALLPECEKLASAILARGPLAIRYALLAIEEGASMPFEEAQGHEAVYFGLAFATEDGREGVRAFVEKRPARFQGK